MMISKTQLLNTLVVAAALCAVPLGCAEQQKSNVATELVEGVVTLDGQPVPEATLTFQPVQPGVGAPATGMSDATGKYTLTAVGLGEGKGAQAGAGTLPGEYFVGVLKDDIPPAPATGEPGYEPVAPTGPPTSPVVTHIVPQKYNVPQTSGIKVTVKAGKNDIPIPLKSE